MGLTDEEAEGRRHVRSGHYEEHNGRHVAWWWVAGGSESDEGTVWEPLYCTRHKRGAVHTMAAINREVEQGNSKAAAEELDLYDDFRLQAEYVPQRWEPTTRHKDGSEDKRAKAKRMIREALGK